jgi:hypothetical protein
VLLNCSVAALPAVVFLLHAQHHVKTAGRYSLVSLTDLTHLNRYRCLLICLASRVVAGRMLLSSAICRLLCLLLCTGFVQHVTAARQVQPGLFDRLDTSQQIHRCLLICLASRRSCRSDAAVLCHLPVVVFIAVCTGFVQHVTAARQVQPGLFDRLDTSQQMHRCLLVCLESCRSCKSHAAVCCYLQVVVLLQHAQVCATCQHRRLQAARSASPIQHIKTIVLGNSSVLLSSYCADAAVYGLFCSEYCCMHRVCASRKSDRY